MGIVRPSRVGVLDRGSRVETSSSGSSLGEVRTVGRKGQFRERRDEIKHGQKNGRGDAMDIPSSIQAMVVGAMAAPVCVHGGTVN